MTDNSSNLIKSTKNGFVKSEESELPSTTSLNMGQPISSSTTPVEILQPIKQDTGSTQVDELKEHKSWIANNNGAILAQMLIAVPTPITRKISWDEFVSLFGLTYEPNDETDKTVSKAKATLHDWLHKVNFSYRTVVTLASKINSHASDFDNALSDIANHISSVESSRKSDNFRKLFE